jgi:RNA polymerase sigma-70 factor (ECF subfamily)
MNDMDDTALVKECLQGNPQAFGILVERYQKVIFNLAFRICNDYNDAQDVSQGVFIKVYENLRKYNKRYKFFSWLYRIAMNEALNMVKFKKNIEQLDNHKPDPDPSPEHQYQQTETDQLIQNALMSLKTEYRLVIILKHLQNFSYQEIARLLNISEKIVKSRLYTARQLLAQVLTDRGIIHNG